MVLILVCRGPYVIDIKRFLPYIDYA